MLNEDNEFALIHGVVQHHENLKFFSAMSERMYVHPHERAQWTYLQYMKKIIQKRGLPCSDVTYYHMHDEGFEDEFLYICYEQGGVRYSAKVPFEWK